MVVFFFGMKYLIFFWKYDKDIIKFVKRVGFMYQKYVVLVIEFMMSEIKVGEFII